MDFYTFVSILIFLVKCTVAVKLVQNLVKRDLISRGFQGKSLVFVCLFMLVDAMIYAPLELYFIYRYENRETINFMPLIIYMTTLICPILLAVGCHKLVKWWAGPHYEMLQLQDDIMFPNMWNFFGNRNQVRRQQQPAPAA